MAFTGSIKPASNRACFSRSSLSASSAPALGPFLWNMASSDQNSSFILAAVARQGTNQQHRISLDHPTEPRQRLLSAAPRVFRRPRDHAAPRSVALGVPIRRLADVERPAGCRGEQDRPPACQNADAADGIEALYRRPRTTKPEPGRKIYPYLLRGKEITRPNQVWAMDITYIPMARGFLYLAVVLDWATPRVLSS